MRFKGNSLVDTRDFPGGYMRFTFTCSEVPKL